MGEKRRRTRRAVLAGLPTWYMETRTSNTIAPHRDQSNDDDVVRFAIDEMHRQGLKVMLKPHVDVRDGTWRAQIAPTDPDRWFESYAAVLDRYTAIAAEKGVAMLCIGTEPLIFTEIGYRSGDGTNRTPWDWGASMLPDTAEQADCYAAMYEVWSREASWMKGPFWWAWDVRPPPAGDTGYNPRGKPAQDVLSQWQR